MEIKEESDNSEREFGSVRFLAFDGGEQIGSIDLLHAPPIWQVAQIEVNKDHRRKGVATQLFNHAQKELGHIEHSQEITEDGLAWIKSLKPQIGSLEEFGFESNQKDPLVSFYTHWDRLPKPALDIVIEHAPDIAQRLESKGLRYDCGEAANAWKEVFDAQGIDAEILDGNYYPEYDSNSTAPTSTEHVWLKVEGIVFDPTAGQFGHDIADEHYHL